MFSRFGLVVALLAADPALADPAAGERCANALPPDASMIYHEAAPELIGNTTIRSVLTAHVRRMVVDGRLKLSEARPAATAAAACLQALQD